MSPAQLTLIRLLLGSMRYYLMLLLPISFSFFFRIFLFIVFPFSSPLFKFTCSPLARMEIMLPLLKTHAVTSYIPAAIIKILVLSFSQKKWSGTVLADSPSHGISPPGLTSPDCHIHLPTIFSSHKVSLIVAWSLRMLCKSASVILSARASLISLSALLTSSISE